MLVILDSSMLMLPLERKINFSYELERLLQISFEIVVPEIIIIELKRLKENPSMSLKQKAKLALELAKQYRILESEKDGNADAEIIKLAEKHKAIVATNDANLRQNLRKKGLTVVSLHGKNKLALFGDIGK
jgi:rRNA-processing protein FCF1